MLCFSTPVPRHLICPSSLSRRRSAMPPRAKRRKALKRQTRGGAQRSRPAAKGKAVGSEPGNAILMRKPQKKKGNALLFAAKALPQIISPQQTCREPRDNDRKQILNAPERSGAHNARSRGCDFVRRYVVRRFRPYATLRCKDPPPAKGVPCPCCKTTLLLS